jgi:hypothetical protein
MTSAQQREALRVLLRAVSQNKDDVAVQDFMAALQAEEAQWLLPALIEIAATDRNHRTGVLAARTARSVVMAAEGRVKALDDNYHWLAWGIAQRARAPPTDGSDSDDPDGEMPDADERFHVLASITPLFFAPQRFPRGTFLVMVNALIDVAVDAAVPLARRVEALRAVSMMQPVFGHPKVVQLLKQRVVPLINADAAPTWLAVAIEVLTRTLGEDLLHDPEMVEETITRFLNIAGVSFEATEALGTLLAIEDDVPSLGNPTKNVVKLLQVANNASYPPRNRLNAAWVIGKIVEAKGVNLLKKKKQLATDLMRMAIGSFALFGDQLLEITSPRSVSRIESDLNTLNMLDELVRVAAPVIPGFVAALRNEIVSKAASEQWSNRVAAVLGFMYGAEGCGTALNEDPELQRALARLLNDDHPLVRFYAMRCFSEATITIIAESIDALTAVVRREVREKHSVLQWNALDLFPNILTKLAAAIDDIKDRGIAQDTTNGDSEDDVVDYGELALDEATQRKIMESAGPMRLAIEALLPEVLTLKDSTNPFVCMQAGHSLRALLSMYGVLTGGKPSGQLPLAAMFDELVEYLIVDRDMTPSHIHMTNIAGADVAHSASLASEITWMTQNSKWRVGYLGALMSLAAVHKEVSNSPAWDKFLEFIARCSTGFLRPADKFSGALLLTYDALICTFPDSRHVVESIDLIVHKALDGTTAEQSAAYIKLDRLPLHLREGQDVAAQTVLDGDRQVEVTEHPDVGQIRETISNSMMLLVHVVKWALPSPERTQMLAPYVYDLSLSLYPRLLACEQAQYAAAEYTHFPELIAELAVAIGLPPKRRTTLLAALLGTLVERQEFEEGEELSFCSQSLSKIAEHINDSVALRVTLQMDGYNRAFICCFERIEVALMGAHLAERALARAQGAGPGEVSGDDDGRDDDTNSAESQQEQDDEDALARVGAESALAQLHNMEIVVNNIPNVIGMLLRNAESVSAQNVLLRKIREYGTSQNHPQSKVSVLAQLNLAWVFARALSSDAELAREFVQLGATLAFNKINECLNDPTKATCEVMQNSFSLLNEIELSFMRQGDNLPQDPIKSIAEQGLKAATEYLTSPLASAKPFAMATTNAVSFAQASEEEPSGNMR